MLDDGRTVEGYMVFLLDSVGNMLHCAYFLPSVEK